MKRTVGLMCVMFVLMSSAVFAADELKVLSATPQGDLNALSDGQALTITFDRPVVALSGVDKDVREGPISVSPDVKGVYRWMGTSTLSFIPESPLMYATRYAVKVKAPLTTVDGAVMSKDFMFSFVTPRPIVRDVYPYQEQTQVTLEQALFIRFNQSIDPKKAAHFVTLTSEGGTEVPVMVSYPEDEDLERQMPYWLRKDDDTTLKILPQQKMAQESSYHLRLKAGLPGKVGTLGMSQSYDLTFRTYNYFRAESIQPGSYNCSDTYYPEFGVSMFFSNAIRYDDLLKHLTVSPALDVTPAEEEYSYESSELYLNLGFQPNTTYTLTIDAEMHDIYGNALGKPAKFAFETVDYAPYLEMPTGRMISEAYLGTRFPIKIMNVFEAPLRMKAYRTPEDLLKAVKMMANYEFDVVEPDVERTYEPDVLTNKVATMPFDLNEVLHEGEETGIIGLHTEYTACWGEPQTNNALIFLTNLSVTAKFSADNNVIWVTQLKDSAPVANAEVELYDENQKFLWKGATDNEGFVESPGWKAMGMKVTDTWNQPWIFAIVRSGTDQVVIHSRDGTGIWPYRFNINYSPDSEHITTDGYVFTERGIYRPGEEVQIVGIVRDKAKGEFVIPEGLTVDVVVSDSDGKELYKQAHKLSDFGSFHLPLKLAENAKIGTYWITCTFPYPDYLKLSKEDREWYSRSISGSFKVEMFRPVEFEVKVALAQEDYIKGDTLDGTVNATYLVGGALREVPVEWNLSRTAYDFRPKEERFAGYSFTTFDEDREYQAQVAQKQDKLDQNGAGSIEQPLKDPVSGSYTYSLDATVTDINQRMVSNRKNVIVHGGEYYIGLKTKSFFATTDQDFAITTLALSPDERIMPEQAYQVDVKRIWWESVRRVGNGGRLYWESEQKEEVVQTFQVQSQAQPLDLTFRAEKVGYYKVEAKGTDRRGNTIQSADYFYTIGSGYAAWLRSDDDYVEIVPDKTAFQPGDVAQILVKSPYEKVKALVTIEREGIIERWVEDIEGSADTIEIPVKPEYIPNVYIGVILIQERMAYDKIEDDLDLGKPGFKIGYTGFKVNPAERHLKVNVATAQEEYRPGTEVEVQLQVVDANGQGREAEVVLSVVDIGVLNLIGYNTPDPFEYFYRERPLAVLTSELRNSIVGQRNFSEKGERAAGGGMDAAAMMKLIELREKFKPTAYFNPSIRTDANGRATVKFTLPDNLTAFRIMATAHTKDSFFGAGDKRITVNKNLMLTSSLPAFLRIGDTIKAGVMAYNRTDEDGKATIQTEVEGVVLSSEDMQDATLPKQGQQEVRFAYKAEEERDATFIFRGMMSGETDGLKVTIPVLLHRLPLTTALFGNTTENSHQEMIAVPPDALPGWGNVKLSLSSTVFTDIKGGVEYLFDYPYGCLEQKISRILPIILAEDLIAAFKLEVFKDDDYRVVVQKTLDEFSAYQTGDGGFGYWKPPYRSSPFVSAYAVFTLFMAKAKGYPVDETMEQRAVTYLENVLKGQNERATIYRYNDLAWNVTDAFILYALTLYDKYQPAYATRLYEARQRLPVFGKALLLKAVARAKGDELILNTLKEELLNAARVEARTAYFEESDADGGLAWIHHSNVRSTAAVAQAFMEVAGASKENETFIPKVLEWLLRERKQKLYWRTTQDNLFVFWALSTYLQTFEGTVPDFTGRVLVNGKEILSELFKGRTTQVAEQWVLLDQLTSGQNNPVKFVKDGEGRMYYTAALTYLPAGTPEPIDAGIAVQKTMTVVKGAQGQPAGTFKRGDIIRIDLTVTTPRDRLFVFVDDPLPAGFKAINLGLQTSNQSLQQYLKNESPFQHSEFLDDRVVFYADYVDNGVHTVSYLVSAEHSGQFNVPPAFSGEMYTPEVFGQTGVAVVEIGE